MRLDHLLSKEKVGAVPLLSHQGTDGGSKRGACKGLAACPKKISGGDALMGNTRTHPEHDG